MALQPLLAWPDSNINGGADYSVDFSALLGCNETIETFEFNVSSGAVAWTHLFGTIATAYITWNASGSLSVEVSAASSEGNTYQASVAILVNSTPCLTPVPPPPRPGGQSGAITDASMSLWADSLSVVAPSGGGWWLNAGIPTYAPTSSGSSSSQFVAPGGLSGFYVDERGVLRKTPSNASNLPDSLTENGGVFMVGSASLPSGLSSNGGVVMTDDSLFYPGAWSNGGVLTVNPNANPN